MRNKLIPYNPALKELARKLRKESTLAEILLWQKIRNKSLGPQFHRQIPLDEFIVDFYCHELMLAIELDGSSHDEALQKDSIRQKRLEDLGVRFIRFTEKEVRKDIDKVLMLLTGVIESLGNED